MWVFTEKLSGLHQNNIQKCQNALKFTEKHSGFKQNHENHKSFGPRAFCTIQYPTPSASIQREQELRIRFPITVQLMRQIKTLISAKSHTYHHTMIWATCSTAFFGLLCCGEFTSPSYSAYDPTVHLSFSNVVVDYRTCSTFIRLTTEQDHFRQRNFDN